MARVFISYAGADLAFADDLKQYLEEAGHKMFLASDAHDGIIAGERWKRRLSDELRQTDAVVCLITSAYLVSEWCTHEVTIGQFWEREFVPIQVESGVIHPKLKSYHHVPLEQAYSHLIKALSRVGNARQADPLLADPADSGGVTQKIIGGEASAHRFTSSDKREVPCGRESEAAQLRTWLDPTIDGDPTVIMVTGLPGVGKTTLAHYAGAQAQDWFGGGAVYVNMNGYDPDPQARTMAEQAYGSLLRALGVEGPRDVSGSDAGHARAVYRRTLAERDKQNRSVLLILDNVSGLDQIQGLLLAECRAHRFVIISRNTDFLAELRGLEKPHWLPLDVLGTEDAVTVLEDIIHKQHKNDQRLSREPDKATTLAKLCGRLPQALQLVGGVLAEQPSMRLDELIRRLNESPFAVLDTVERAFRVSWQHLKEKHGEQAASLLLLLSVNPGPDISIKAVAALGGAADETRGGLQVLQCAHLINYAAGTDRWGMHDLVREHVHKLAAECLSADDRDAAFGRLLSHYEKHASCAARQAGWFLLRHSRPGPEKDPPPTWTGRMEALRYFETERLNLLGFLRHPLERVRAMPEPDRDRWVALTDAMAGYLRNNGPWKTAEQAQATAASIAEDLGNRQARAIVLNHLGITHRLQGQWNAANQAVEEAQRIFGGLSDPRTRLLGQANTLNEMGIVANERGRHADARSHHGHALKSLEDAWDLYCHPDVDDPIGKANSAKNRGVALYRLGESGKADEWLGRSLEIYLDISDFLGVVEVNNHLGLIHLGTNHQRARDKFNEAIMLMGKEGISSPLEEARAHEGIGRCQGKGGEFADAITSLEKAERRYSSIGANQDRDRVATKLDGLRDHADG